MRGKNGTDYYPPGHWPGSPGGCQRRAGQPERPFDGTFDRIKCRNGVIKGIIIAACFVAFYVAGRLNPDIVAIDIDGETVNVATAANLAMVTAYVLYAKDVFSKLSKLVLSKTSGTPEQTGGTTPPALEEPADAAEATAAE